MKLSHKLDPWNSHSLVLSCIRLVSVEDPVVVILAVVKSINKGGSTFKGVCGSREIAVIQFMTLQRE